MITRYISSKVVVGNTSKIFTTSNWKISAMGHLGDAIQQIGYASKRDNTIYNESFVVANHKAEIPCNVEIIEKIEVNGCRIPVTKDASMRGIVCDDYIWGKQEQDIMYYDIDYPYLIFSFEESEDVTMFFRSFDYDEEGWLMIPDYNEYRLALQWYLTSHLLLEGYKTKVPMNFAEANSMFDSYERKAKKRVKQFSRDERAAFAKMWNSLNTTYLESRIADSE